MLRILSLLAFALLALPAQAEFALVEPSGRIAEIADKTFPVSEPLQWIEVGPEVTTAHRYVDGEIVAPAPIEPEPSRPDPLAELQAKLDAVTAVLIEEDPAREAKIEAERGKTGVSVKE